MNTTDAIVTAYSALLVAGGAFIWWLLSLPRYKRHRPADYTFLAMRDAPHGVPVLVWHDPKSHAMYTPGRATVTILSDPPETVNTVDRLTAWGAWAYHCGHAGDKPRWVVARFGGGYNDGEESMPDWWLLDEGDDNLDAPIAVAPMMWTHMPPNPFPFAQDTH